MTTYEDILAAKLGAPAPDPVPSTGLPRHLFEWQRVVVEWALRRGRAAMFEDCGLGKTIQELAWAEAVVRFTNLPVLIFAPLGASIQTAAEAEKFDIEARRIRESGEINGAGLFITNYERAERFDASGLGGVVLDESSILKDVSGATRRLLTERFRGVRYRLSCTATPCPNDVVELGNQAEFLGVMTRAAMLATFFINDQKIEAASGKWRLKRHAESAFYDWLATWSVYIRTPADIGFDGSAYDLPTLTEKVVTVPHESALDGMLFKVEARSLGDLREVRRNSIAERLDALMGLPVDVESPRLTWCGLNAEADALAEAYPEATELRGTNRDEVKEETLMAFARGELHHLITKARIGGHGMNWQVCHRQEFFGMDHSWEGYYQAMRRIWRFGQSRPVMTHIIISDVSMHVWRVIMKKRESAERMSAALAERMGKSMRRELEEGRRAVPRRPREKAEGEGWVSHHDDSVEMIQETEDDSVGYQVMSPPFPDVYAYSDNVRDMGNADWGAFWEQMDYLIPEMLRVSMPGRLATFHCMDIPIQKAKDGYVGLRDFPGEIIRRFTAAGWIFFARRTIWKDPVVENARSHSLGHGNLLKDSTKSRAGLPDYLVTFLKPGANEAPVGHERETFPVEQWQKWASSAWSNGQGLTAEEEARIAEPPEWMTAPVWFDIRQSDTLQRESAREEKDEKHICPLQLTVIERCLTMWSAPGDLIASWFSGIGSEGYVAVRMGRKALLCELKKSYWEQGVRNMRTAERFKLQETLF